MSNTTKNETKAAKLSDAQYAVLSRVEEGIYYGSFGSTLARTANSHDSCLRHGWIGRDDKVTSTGIAALRRYESEATR